MAAEKISGQHQMDFLADFDYIRAAGTPDEKKAALQIQRTLESLGVENRLEEFTFETFRIKKAKLLVMQPYQKEYTVTAYGRCADTAKMGLCAPFLYVENGDAISLKQAKGKIVMLNDAVKTEMYQKLVNAGAEGFITICGTPLDEGEDLKPRAYRLPEKLQAAMPGCAIHYKDAVELVTKGASKICLQIEQESVSATSQNVIARIPGTDRAQEILTLTAHYDSVAAGPGAYDNMAGAAVIMELCRYFQVHRPRRTLEFIWFGAEEEGLLGSQSYVNTHSDELFQHVFHMNVDLAGQLVGGNVFGVTAGTKVCEVLMEIAVETGIGTSLKNQIWGSDSNTFAWKGIPAMTLNRDGFGMHTRHDTLDLISAWSLERSALLLGHLAERLANADEMPFERNMPEKFTQELDRYFAVAH